MRPLSAWVVILVAVGGCPSTHFADDAVCPDRDGDGATDAACGGPDCADGDASLSPARGRCTSATRRERCVAGEVMGELCPLVCDARSGACTDRACGDGVLHDGESCDDGNGTDGDGCDADCRFSLCVSDADCPAEAPSCSELVPDGTAFRCRPLQPGGAPSAPCTADLECATGFCDREQGRCSHGCMENEECGAFEAWCMWPETSVITDARFVGPHRCGYGCLRDEECPSGSTCYAPYMTREGEPQPGYSTCRAINAAGAPYPEQTVTESLGCQSWLYDFGEPDIGLRCTRICASDADCRSSFLPICATRIVRPPRGADWRTPDPLLCLMVGR